MVVVIRPSSAYFLSNQIGSLSFRAILQICGMNVHNNIAHKIVGLEFEIFIKNVVAVAAYIRHSLSQWPSRSRGWTFLSSFLSRNPSFIPDYVTSRLCYKMAESLDRSSSTEPQLKFPGCSHYRRRMDNHFRCQQCRYNEGLTLCMQ